jgi:MFS transporter, AAHS family, 4-hydroxybenzoate transporter
MFFMNLLNLYFLNGWLPTVMHDSGIAVETAIVVTALFQVGGAMGTLVLGRVVDRYLSFGVLTWIYVSAGLFILLAAEAGTAVRWLVLAGFACGFCVIGGQSASNALAAEYYPTAIRSTGVGWALGVGRIGSIVGPTLGGVLLTIGGGTREMFRAAAVPAIVAAAAACAAAVAVRKGRSQ